MLIGSEPLEIRVEDVDLATIVTIEGSAGIYNAERFVGVLAKVQREGRPVVILDIAGMTFISSRGLGSMVSLARDRRDREGHVRLVNPTRQIRELLSATRLMQILPVYETLDQAMIV